MSVTGVSGDPSSLPEILRALTEAEHDVASFFASLSREELVLRLGEAWTPAEHLEHLSLSVRAIARGLAAPPWLLRLSFGRPIGRPRSFAELRQAYRARLDGGARASAAFIPASEQVDPERISERRTDLLRQWARVNAAMQRGLGRWRESDLDHIALPHPILGRISAREMLLFAIYHDEHHIAAAKTRLPRFRQPTSGQQGRP